MISWRTSGYSYPAVLSLKGTAWSLGAFIALAYWLVNEIQMRASLMAKTVKNLPAMQETWVWSLGQEDPLEETMTAPSSILAWEFHGWRSLAGPSRKESDVAEWLTHTLEQGLIVMLSGSTEELLGICILQYFVWRGQPDPWVFL